MQFGRTHSLGVAYIAPPHTTHHESPRGRFFFENFLGSTSTPTSGSAPLFSVLWLNPQSCPRPLPSPKASSQQSVDPSQNIEVFVTEMTWGNISLTVPFWVRPPCPIPLTQAIAICFLSVHTRSSQGAPIFLPLPIHPERRVEGQGISNSKYI